MLIWSKKFETNIDIVDTEHKNLFELVNKLTNSIIQRESAMMKSKEPPLFT